MCEQVRGVYDMVYAICTGSQQSFACIQHKTFEAIQTMAGVAVVQRPSSMWREWEMADDPKRDGAGAPPACCDTELAQRSLLRRALKVALTWHLRCRAVGASDVGTEVQREVDAAAASVELLAGAGAGVDAGGAVAADTSAGTSGPDAPDTGTGGAAAACADAAVVGEGTGGGDADGLSSHEADPPHHVSTQHTLSSFPLSDCVAMQLLADDSEDGHRFLADISDKTAREGDAATIADSDAGGAEAAATDADAGAHASARADPLAGTRADSTRHGPDEGCGAGPTVAHTELAGTTAHIIDSDAGPWSVQGIPSTPYNEVLAAVLARWWRLRSFPLAYARMDEFAETAQVLNEMHTEKVTAAVVSACEAIAASPSTESLRRATAVPIGSIHGDRTSPTPARRQPPAEEDLAIVTTALRQDPATLTEVYRLVCELLRAAGGARGVMHLLGIRRTVKSVDVLPPRRRTLLAAFERLHAPGRARITVGARALAKHSHRASEGWWGTSTGSEAAKNEWGLRTVKRIIDGCTWMNVHLLPHATAIFEARLPAGYGARWAVGSAAYTGVGAASAPSSGGGHTIDATDGESCDAGAEATTDSTGSTLAMSGEEASFRGFLEPPMPDGHTRGWKH